MSRMRDEINFTAAAATVLIKMHREERRGENGEFSRL
jgi:hypothetical protein